MALLLAVPASAQLPDVAGPMPVRFGAGYVANAPHLLLGGAAWGSVAVLGGLGLYVDAKFDASSPSREDDFIADMTAQEVDDQIGDTFLRGEDSWWSMNAALVKPVTRQLTLYAGAGMTERTRYRQYYDTEQNRGILGYYWVEDPVDSGRQVNILAGGLFGLNEHLVFQFGGETAPWGFTVGLAVGYPSLEL